MRMRMICGFGWLLLVAVVGQTLAVPIGTTRYDLPQLLDDPEYRSALAILAEGRAEQADEAFQRLLEAKPQHLYAMLARADIAIKRGQLDSARQWIDQAMAVNPNAPEAYNMRGLVQTDVEQAKLDFQQAFTLEPRFFSPRLHLAVIYRHEKRFGEAVEQYEAVIAIAPELDLGYLGLADTHLENGDFEESIDALNRWKVARPQSPAPANALGLTYASKQQFDNALQAFDDSLAIDPSHVSALKNKADVYMMIGQVETAIEMYEMTLRESPEYLEVYVRLGIAYYQARAIDEAISTYERAITIEPDYPVSYNNLAWIRLQEGRDVERALDLAKSATKLAPDYADAQNTLGLIYLRTSQLDEAIETLMLADRLRPNHANTLANLGIALYEKGRKSEALKKLSRALELNPQSEQSDRIKDILANIKGS